MRRTGPECPRPPRRRRGGAARCRACRALERGIDVADVGCGAGRALLGLAQRFPRPRFTGFDTFPAQVETRPGEGGVGRCRRPASRVTFDAAQGLPRRHDLVTTFDVIHDSAEPTRLLAAVRATVKGDADYLPRFTRVVSCAPLCGDGRER
ncbi:class I SAM-dependent methyltransferase [Streptomyces bottropensis]